MELTIKPPHSFGYYLSLVFPKHKLTATVSDTGCIVESVNKLLHEPGLVRLKGSETASFGTDVWMRPKVSVVYRYRCSLETLRKMQRNGNFKIVEQ
jgi:hypothetical protein